MPNTRGQKWEGARWIYLVPTSLSRPCAATGALPCIRVELCQKIWILLVFLTTHVSFLWDREVRRGKYPPKLPQLNPRDSELKSGCRA